MKKQYTKKQIQEAISYWEKQLEAGNYRKVNESIDYAIFQAEMPGGRTEEYDFGDHWPTFNEICDKFPGDAVIYHRHNGQGHSGSLVTDDYELAKETALEAGPTEGPVRFYPVGDSADVILITQNGKWPIYQAFLYDRKALPVIQKKWPQAIRRAVFKHQLD